MNFVLDRSHQYKRTKATYLYWVLEYRQPNPHRIIIWLRIDSAHCALVLRMSNSNISKMFTELHVFILLVCLFMFRFET